ncbi:hypothetical protein AHiyo1_48680 [Arthrobacter sp. Hiyo1]|uniref:hypothetical protein n=1 Tax=Arthrobacter sp. Hiyo1 TaxID=1588020 RepID=UPI0006A3AC9A|nr:hypothetical protein [Arthrobacter sp. Hiyo1]GAP61196.1 hypothetical protein AHiyo1_48680 [Arthrobacter sp. Hiyo1]
MSTNLESLIPARPATRPTLVVLSGFTAALCWWIVLVGVVNSGAGAIFLVVPVLATIATFRAARRQSRHHKAQHVNQSRRHRASRAQSAHRGSMVILYGFTAALCWWIGIAGVINSGGGAFFLIIPVLATAGTLLAARYKGRAPKTYAT